MSTRVTLFVLLVICFARTAEAQAAAKDLPIEKEFLWGPMTTRVDLNTGESMNYGSFIRDRSEFQKSIICAEVSFSGNDKTFIVIKPGQSVQIGNDQDWAKVIFNCSATKVNTGMTVHLGCTEAKERESRHYNMRAEIPEAQAVEIARGGSETKVQVATMVAQKACSEFGGVLNRAPVALIPGKIVPKKQ